MRLIIVGGGIGGLTVALAGVHFGYEVVVLEQAPELGDVGAGIQLSPNAMKVFGALGLADAVTDAGFQPKAIEIRMGRTGRRLLNTPLGENTLDRWGAPYVHIYRPDLMTILENALREQAPNSVRLGQRFTGYKQSDDRITARLANGDHVQGDILIGADGIHSAVRAQMLGPGTPRFTGHVAWRAVVPVNRLGEAAPPPTACAWMGRNRHAVSYLLQGGHLANFVGVVERHDWAKESWYEKGQKEDALADFEGWHPSILRLIEEADRLHRWALFDRAPLKKWTEGRAVLLGDSAHPMLPFMAQGAAMAIEDSWVLVSKLAQISNPKAAVLSYKDSRLERTGKVQARSAANGRLFHQRSALGRAKIFGGMWLMGRVAPQIFKSKLDWIYSYNAAVSS